MLNSEKCDQQSKCQTCQDMIVSSIEYPSIIFIDLQSTKKRTNAKPVLPICQLTDLPKTITLNGYKYSLESVIEFKDGHYISHCRSEYSAEHFLEFNDLSKEIKPSTHDKIEPNILLYSHI